VQDVPLVVQVSPPGDEVTMYVTVPALVDDAVQLIVAAAFAAVATTLLGAPGRGVVWSWWQALAMREKANKKNNAFALCSTRLMYAWAPIIGGF
jgi:hypothetical protein